MKPLYDQQNIIPALPKRIDRLYELANNLWWSWQEDGRQVFRSLDYAQWRNSNHNPVKQLRDMGYDKLEEAARDPAFLELYDSVMLKFDADLSGEKTWCSKANLPKFERQIAYFSAEYAIHGSLPIYAGGLGVLAGDICKEASDLGLPLVAVGFMYPQGYFHQTISAEGWQLEIYRQLNFSESPISPCAWPEACGPLVEVPLADRTIYLSVWHVRVGRVNLYLLNTDIEENTLQDRNISARLYEAAEEERMRQLIVLGVGGVRALRMLGLNPAVWHANEDHTAFMMLERLREEVERGTSFQEALAGVRAQTVFTTHTPIAAGHNIFSLQMMDRYAPPFWESLKIDRETFLQLGRYDGLEPGRFSLTALALRLAGHANAVSRLHGGVTRKLWHVLWPDRPKDEEPIIHITNGVHLLTWQAPELRQLCRKYMGTDWWHNQVDPKVWECMMDIPDEEFWEIHQRLKTRLIHTIQDRAQQRWGESAIPAQQMVAMGALLDPYALTIAFTRRFTAYKRPGLIQHDLERLKKIVNNPLRPVQIIFAGKSHPADLESKRLLNRIYLLAMDRSFQGRIAFVEDYDLHFSRDIVRGVDLWLNTPRRLQEACGTSGMKASMNGVINLSIRDGWWDEGYNGANGWAIDGYQGGGPDEEDRADSEALYSLLENEIVPMYYDRDRAGIPHRWVKVAKEAIKSISPVFNSCRMMTEYTQRMYMPAVSGEIQLPGTAGEKPPT